MTTPASAEPSHATALPGWGARGGRLTGVSLAALLLGFVGGLWIRATGASAGHAVASMLTPAADLWLLALRLFVVPLVVTQLLAAVLAATDQHTVGRLGVRTVSTMVPILFATGVLSLVVVAPAATWLELDATAAAPAGAGPPGPPTSAVSGVSSTPGRTPPATPMERLDGLALALSGRLLWLIAATIGLGLVLARLPSRLRDVAVHRTRGLAVITLRIMSGILWVTPLAVLALVLRLTVETGVDMWWALWFYVVLVCGWLLVVTAGLYPVAAGFGKTSLRQFARAVAPAQLVALSTRSSLMSLPALVEGGRTHLGLSAAATGLVLPLCTSVFKMSTVTVEPTRYLFLAHVYGVPITLESAATFLVSIVVLSFSGVGIPGGGSGFDTLPAFAAAGIPAEGLVLVAAVDTLPDIAMTLINVTGHMCVTTIVTRTDRAAR